MIEYGAACLIVITLCLFDRRMLPFALILSAGWLAGFGPVQWGPFISIVSGVAMAGLITRRSSMLAYLVVACVPVMLLLDALYFGALANNVYLGVEYAAALNALFAVQLVACGWRGGRNAVRSFVLWFRRLDRGRVGRGSVAADTRDASQDY